MTRELCDLIEVPSHSPGCWRRAAMIRSELTAALRAHPELGRRSPRVSKSVVYRDGRRWIRLAATVDKVTP